MWKSSMDNLTSIQDYGYITFLAEWMFHFRGLFSKRAIWIPLQSMLLKNCSRMIPSNAVLRNRRGAAIEVRLFMGVMVQSPLLASWLSHSQGEC